MKSMEFFMSQNDRLTEENNKLRAENAELKAGWDAVNEHLVHLRNRCETYKEAWMALRDEAAEREYAAQQAQQADTSLVKQYRIDGCIYLAETPEAAYQKHLAGWRLIPTLKGNFHPTVNVFESVPGVSEVRDIPMMADED